MKMMADLAVHHVELEDHVHEAVRGDQFHPDI